LVAGPDQDGTAVITSVFHVIGSGEPVRIIAEIGVNHNGDLRTALELVESARRVGADAVKIQVFQSDLLVSSSAPLADYQARSVSGTQLSMLRRVELSQQDVRQVATVCGELGIPLLATPFDLNSLRFLVEELDLGTLKIGSGDVTNAPLILAAAIAGRNVILSTGMSTLAEVGAALGILALGYTSPGLFPTLAHAADARASRAGVAALQERVCLLHCTSAYPAPAQDSNLRALDTLRREFGLTVGISDHADGAVIAVAAVARGAMIVEKHLTLDRSMSGPDHLASLEPDEFAALVRQVRTVEMALGSGDKLPQPSEENTRRIARRSLAAISEVDKGEPFTASNLGVLRPGTGMDPMRYWEMLDRPSSRHYRRGDLISE
jgi:sialic acid synthase SpsE